MNKSFSSLALATLAVALLAPLPSLAQNVAIVNGKAVPKARYEALLTQVTKQGQPKTPALEAQVRDEVVLREMFVQEAEKRGLTATPDYKMQMEFARQTILIRELFTQFQEANAVTDADIKGEYDKFKSQSAGVEYRARHILVESEDQAKALIVQIKGGASFEDLAKKSSKDTGSGANGGDLDFANAAAYVPEFSQAMTKLKKGEMTDVPVKSQFGFHIIRLDDTREAKVQSLDEIKPQIQQRIAQLKMAKFRDEIRSRTKTDYKFAE